MLLGYAAIRPEPRLVRLAVAAFAVYAVPHTIFHAGHLAGFPPADALAQMIGFALELTLVVVGDNQDELSGELRWVVKTLRQRAGILMALDPRVTPIASEIRARTQEVLRNPAWHEGARH